MFTKKDVEELASRGIGLEAIEKQIDKFRLGFPFIDLVRPATTGDGIVELSEFEARRHAQDFGQESGRLNILKFVPASGAASRMFKHLYHFLEHYADSHDSIHKLLHDHSINAVWYFLENLKKFAFYHDLEAKMAGNSLHLPHCMETKDYASIIRFLLHPEGLNYGNLPKGLLKFHQYGAESRTAVEEHLVEGVNYSCDASAKVHLHFSLSPEHVEKFRELLATALPVYSDTYHVQFDIGWSVQKPSTDTIAVDMENKPFRDNHGRLVFRPGGHGALIENLNDLDADLVFIKNIDNVVPDKYKPSTYLYKKALGGLILRLRQKSFDYLRLLEQDEPGIEMIMEIADFSRNELFINLPWNFKDLPDDEKQIILFTLLDRPMRVCGMVKNQGEPGGGPFWTRNTSGEVSLQIIESSQVDAESEKQKLIALHATHFNPVDLVCSIKDYQGNKYDLRKFTDPDTGFISVKSKDGRNLKAQELPGLWNGAMANWITVFAEVPIITFNPVKTVNDLLRKEHQD
jgi:hypothetical protein